MILRKAEKKDLPALLAIYNDAVISSTATFDLNPKKMEEWEKWYDAHNKENHPLLVAELPGGIVAGYGSLSPYREKEAYKSTVELSVYIHKDLRRRGIGDALMTALLNAAEADPITHTVVSVITGGNLPSIRLHEKFGFTCGGTVREVGFKHGAYLDIVQYYKIV